jgi:hypothetical protein
MTKYTCFASLVLLAVLLAAAGCGHESVAGQANQVAVPPAEVDPAPAIAPAATAADPPRGAPPVEVAVAAEPAAEPQPAKPMGQRPPADRGPSRPGQAEKITFDDLNLGMQADMVYRPFLLTDRVKELDGKRLSLTGYMHGGVDSTKNVKEFILLKNIECKFGPGGQADHLADVKLKGGESIRFTRDAVKVEATLKIEPYEGPDGNTWSIYRLEDAKIVR